MTGDRQKSEKINANRAERIEAVILAAGYSSRAGCFKMELPFQGKTVLQHVIDAFYPYCDKIYIVGGFQYEKLLPLVEPYKDKVRLVINENFDQGMFSSVQTGVHNVNADRFFITPGDYPLICQEVIRDLLLCKEEYVIPSAFHRAGHPLLLPGKAKEEILLMQPDSNLKVFLKNKKITYMNVSDQGILHDIDTMEDYEKLLKMKDREAK